MLASSEHFAKPLLQRLSPSSSFQPNRKHHCGEEITFPSLIEATSGEQCKTQTSAAAAAVPGQPNLKSSSTTALLQAEVPQSYDSKERKDGSGRQQLIEDDTQSDHHQHHHHQQTTTENSGCEQSRQRVVTTITTLTRKTSQQRRRANKEEEEDQEEIEKGAEEEEEENKMKQQQTQPTDGGGDEQQKQQKRIAGDEKATGDREEADSITISKTSSQRKTWQTSPEEVEELTRSLSRLRTDPEHGGYLYEKMVEKEKSKTISSTAGNRRQTKQAEKQGGKTAASKQHQMSTQPILISSTTTMIDQPHLVNGSGNHHHHHHQQQQYVVKQLNNGPTTTQPAKAEPFLPPLTGFSDSDSSFGSFSCSVEGDHHLLPTSSTAAGGASGDHRQVQCICESLKKSKLEETENFDGNAGGAAAGENGGNINFIDVDDNWIVTRPKRSKPRDNLRLEGPMEMETTFRSTYETTAQRMITDRGEEEGSMKAASSKRSTAATSRQGSKGSCGSPSSGGLYLNTRRGRNGLPATPLLRSAKSRRRHTRNRPMTSLKAGGDGYYNTISRDAYKNFIIVNGEAKMVGSGGGGGGAGGIDGGHHVKLPKVVTKTTLTTSEEKNRQKFAKSGGGKSAKIGGMEATMVVAKTSDEQLEKMVMIGGEQIRKFEKKSYIAKSDGGQEVTDVERKIIRKVKCAGGGPKDANGDGHKEDDDEDGDKAAGEKTADHDEQPVGTHNYTIDTISGAPRRPFHARYQDNIRELGLLDRSDEAMAAGNMADNNYRHTTRRLHETSKDFNLQMPASPGPGLRAPGRQLPKVRPEVKVKLQSEAEALKAASSRPSRMVANGSHVMARPAHKPFILPQRIHRHKNECSVNVFEGDIDFTTTNRWAYGDVREGGGGGGGGGRKSSVRVGSAQRKRTAGRRYLKSSKRRNLFRQSSDSMFSSPGQGQETGAWAAAAATKESSGAAASTSMAGHDHTEQQATITSTYQKNFDDRLYCPALDVACQSHNNNNNNSENFKYTGEAGGHKYYLSSNYS